MPNSIDLSFQRNLKTRLVKGRCFAAFLVTCLLIQILPGIPTATPFHFFFGTIEQSLNLLIRPAFAQRVGTNSICNCTLDSTTYGHLTGNITGITIPKVKIVQNESLQSQTEGHLTWKAIRPLQLMGILTNGFFLGNFSSGTGATVALNSLNVRPNDTIGIQISGGTMPTVAKAELLKANVDVNGTLSQIKTVGKTISNFNVEHGKNMKPALVNNKLLVGIDTHPNNYLLLISLTFDNVGKPVGPSAKGLETDHLVAIYETVLQVA